jgi:hypothetical protein
MFACSSLLDLLLCCCVHPCELAAWWKSISQLFDRKLKVILQAVFEKKIRPPALQQYLVHSLLDRTLGATKQWRRNVFTSHQVSASWIVLWRRRLWIRLLISSGEFFFPVSVNRKKLRSEDLFFFFFFLLFSLICSVVVWKLRDDWEEFEV